MNKRMGIYSSIITFFAVFSFALCMLLGLLLGNDIIGKTGSYFSSLFIAFGYVLLVCSYLPYMNKENNSFGLISLAFSIMYATLITIVYFTQLTTIQNTNLSTEMMEMLDYSKFGLFFNLNLLGYAFMALSTFFLGIKLETKNRQEKILKYLLCIHGIFAISCFVMPILGIFNKDMVGGDIYGTIVLEFWCIYFIPICVLSYKYFNDKE